MVISLVIVEDSKDVVIGGSRRGTRMRSTSWNLVRNPFDPHRWVGRKFSGDIARGLPLRHASSRLQVGFADRCTPASHRLPFAAGARAVSIPFFYAPSANPRPQVRKSAIWMQSWLAEVGRNGLKWGIVGQDHFPSYPWRIPAKHFSRAFSGTLSTKRVVSPSPRLGAQLMRKTTCFWRLRIPSVTWPCCPRLRWRKCTIR